MTYIGIDISKKTFEAAFPSSKGFETKTFDNDIKGIRNFISFLSPEDTHCVMEATGNYCFLLCYLLDKSKIRLSLLNPKQSKTYARMQMSVTKTDKADACLLADYGRRMTPSPYTMPTKDIMILKQKRTTIRLMKKHLNALKNQMEAIEVLPFKSKECVNAIKKNIKFLEKEIKELEYSLVSSAEQTFDKQLKLLTSIKGIGTTMATALIIATGGFTQFHNAKQFSRYMGICPQIMQSGTSLNIKGHINRNGDSSIRSQLYVCSWTAIQYNAECKSCYERLRRNGKPKKVALIAVCNKLIRQCFAVVNSNMSYIDGFVSSKPLASS